MQIKETTIKRCIVAKFDPGEDLLESLESCVKARNIRHGFFQIIGGVDKTTYGVYSKESREYKLHEKAGFHELLANGNIAEKGNGEVFVHCHIFINNQKCESSGGHLLKGTRVFPFAEVFIQETETPINRTFDKDLNLWPMKFSPNP